MLTPPGPYAGLQRTAPKAQPTKAAAAEPAKKRAKKPKARRGKS
jgi:hypothetical protein